MGEKKGWELMLVVERGVDRRTGKISICPSPPGREFRPEGKGVLYGRCSVSIASHDR